MAPLYLAAAHLYRGDDQARVGALVRLAERCQTPLVATNDVLYHTSSRRPLQDVLTCIREKTTIGKAGFLLEANGERHIKSPAAMARLFHGHEDALRRTVEIARACRFSLDELAYEYPDEPVPPGHSPQSYLEEISWRGADWRFPDGVPAKVRDALEKELALIAQLEYAPYFLTVYDIVHFARAQGILCQGRGSAGQFGGLLLPCHYRGQSDRSRSSVRALRQSRTQGAAGYRCRFRARTPRRGDPVSLCPLRPRPRRPGGNRDFLPRPFGGA